MGDGSGPGGAPHSYLMGFSAIPPRYDSTATVILGINNWLPHADAAIMHVSPPWAAMLAGHSPAGAVDTVEIPLAQYYRSPRRFTPRACRASCHACQGRTRGVGQHASPSLSPLKGNADRP